MFFLQCFFKTFFQTKQDVYKNEFVLKSISHIDLFTHKFSLHEAINHSLQ